MASEGGGKIKSKGGHSPAKPDEQRKSFFQRITDSIKDVIRPSWLGDDPPDVAGSPSQTEEKSSEAAACQKKSKEPLSERSSFSNQSATSSSPPQADTSIGLGNTTDPWSVSSSNSSGLWSHTATAGQCQQSALSCDGSQQMESSSSVFGSSGPVSRNTEKHYDFSQLRRPPLRNVASPHSQSSLSYARQRQLRQQSDQGSSSVSRRRGMPEAGAAATPSKQQRLWTPETSRKGRSLQPAVRDQPGFKMSVFCSSNLAETEAGSPFYPGKTNYGVASSYRKHNLNISLPYQSSQPVRKSVTPKPLNRSGSAVLSSSTTQIFKTLERLSDAKRARMDLRNDESLLSFSSSSYRRTSRPLQSSLQSRPIETPPPAETGEANSHEIVSISTAVSSVTVSTSSIASQVPVSVPSPVSRSPEFTAPPPQKAEEQVVISDDSSDDDDEVQIIESPAEVPGRIKGPGHSSVAASQPNKKGLEFGQPVKVTQGPCVASAGSPLMVGFGGSASSPFNSPSAWGSTTPKPKSIIAGNGKTSTSNLRKCVSFSDSKSEETGGSMTSANELKSGSVMDILGKSPESSSSSSLKSAGSSSSGPAVSTTDSLFTKFTAPAGSWDCEMCLVRNKPEVTQCVACQASKPGAAQKAIPSPAVSTTDSLFAKFTVPAGSWDCEMCLVRNKPEVTQCVACQARKPGSGATPAATSAFSSSSSTPVSVGSSGGLVFGVKPSTPDSNTSPFLPPPPSASKGAFGGVTLGSSSSQASGSASVGFRPSTASGTVGFKFGASPTTSSAFPATGGFKLGSSSSESVGSSGSSGFAFGKPDAVSLNSASSGFQFGGKDLSSSQSTKDSGVTKSDSVSTTAGGFQFGVAAANSVPSVSTTSTSLLGGHSVTATDTTESDRTVFGIPNHCEKRNLNVEKDDGEVTFLGASDCSKTTPCTSAPPLLSAKKTCDSVAIGAGQSVPTKTAKAFPTGCFHSSKTTNIEKSSPFMFGSTSASSKVTLNGSDSSLQPTSDLKTSSANSGFSFGSANKQVTSSTALSSQNGPNMFAQSSVSKGFVFGSPSLLNSPSSVSGAITKPSVGALGSERTSPAAKTAINGEAGAVEKCAFGESVAASSATVGFASSSPFVHSKKATDGLTSFAQDKQPSLFGAEPGSEKTSCEKDHIDNGTPAVDGAEPFKFAGPAAATAFKFGQTSGLGSESSLGSPALSKQSNFGFSAQTNAASSKELPTSQTSLFVAGSGNTSTGQFSFSVGAGSQSNAAAASPQASEVSAPVKGFGFSGATQPSFSFGSESSSNTAAPAFQFASPSVDTTSAQSSSGAFTFGKVAPSASTSNPAPTAVSFGADRAQNSHSMEAGDGPRKLKRAVRRIPKE